MAEDMYNLLRAVCRAASRWYDLSDRGEGSRNVGLWSPLHQGLVDAIPRTPDFQPDWPRASMILATRLGAGAECAVRCPPVAEPRVMSLTYSGMFEAVLTTATSWPHSIALVHSGRGWQWGSGQRHLEYDSPGLFTLAPAGAPRRWATLVPTVAEHFWIDRGLVADIGEALSVGTVELREDQMAMLDRDLLRLLMAWRSVIDFPEMSGGLQREALELMIAYRLVTLYGVRLPSPRQTRISRFGAEEASLIKEYIDANLGSTLRIRDLATVIDLDELRFARGFKANFGVTVHQYVVRQRIVRSQSLLRTSTMPVATIAQMLGFTDQAHFSNAFTKTVGMSPTRFRAENGFGRAGRENRILN